MIWQTDEVRETLRMFESERLDIRTVTLGVNLLGCAAGDLPATCGRVEERLLAAGDGFVRTVEGVQADLGVPIVNKRVAVTPMALVLPGTGADSFVAAAQSLDRAGAALGVDYVAGFSALVAKGYTPADRVLIEVPTTQRIP